MNAERAKRMVDFDEENVYTTFRFHSDDPTGDELREASDKIEAAKPGDVFLEPMQPGQEKKGRASNSI